MHETHFRGSNGGLLHMYQGYTVSFVILIAHFVLVIYKGIGRPSASKRKVRVFFGLSKCLGTATPSTNTFQQSLRRWKYFEFSLFNSRRLWDFCNTITLVFFFNFFFDELTAHSIWWKNGLNKNNIQIYFYKFHIECVRMCACTFVYVWPICLSFSLMEFKWKFNDSILYVSKEIIHIISLYLYITRFEWVCFAYFICMRIRIRPVHHRHRAMSSLF